MSKEGTKKSNNAKRKPINKTINERFISYEIQTAYRRKRSIAPRICMCLTHIGFFVNFMIVFMNHFEWMEPSTGSHTNKGKIRFFIFAVKKLNVDVEAKTSARRKENETKTTRIPNNVIHLNGISNAVNETLKRFDLPSPQRLFVVLIRMSD